ncbi:MAG: hypothetical protein KGM18_00785 [Sphingomonadales bacterium]|nr:hypothetical protein [Sphingomonadales bacterium]
MDIDERNRETANRCLDAAWLQRRLHGPGAWLDAGDFVLRQPALSEIAPVTDESYDLIASQQRPLVVTELIRACRRRGWSGHLPCEARPENPDDEWITLEFSGITVEVDYANYGLFDEDPDELSHFLVLASFKLAIKGRHCGLVPGADGLLAGGDAQF